jgi:hypothetical protein
VITGFNRNENKQNMRHVWMSFAINDKTAFYLTLANASLHLATRAGDIETAESISHYTIAAKITEQRLHDSNDGISEGMIVTVLGFACHDVRSYFPITSISVTNTTCSILLATIIDGPFT